MAESQMSGYRTMTKSTKTSSFNSTRGGPSPKQTPSRFSTQVNPIYKPSDKKKKQDDNK
jgi:hypothetical protein